MPASAWAARSFNTETGSAGPCGNGPPRAARSESRVAVAPTWRAATSSRNRVAIVCAVSKTCLCIMRSTPSPIIPVAGRKWGTGTPLPERDEREIACRGPLLPFDRGPGREDRARVVAVRESKPVVEPRPEVRLEGGHRDRAFTRRVDAVGVIGAAERTAGGGQPVMQRRGEIAKRV